MKSKQDVGICTINSKSVNRYLDHPQKVGNTIIMISSSFYNILNPHAKVFSFISTPNISLDPYARVFSYFEKSPIIFDTRLTTPKCTSIRPLIYLELCKVGAFFITILLISGLLCLKIMKLSFDVQVNDSHEKEIRNSTNLVYDLLSLNPLAKSFTISPPSTISIESNSESNDSNITLECVICTTTNLSIDSVESQLADNNNINIGNIDNVVLDPENVFDILKSLRKKNLNKLIIAS